MAGQISEADQIKQVRCCTWERWPWNSCAALSQGVEGEVHREGQKLLSYLRQPKFQQVTIDKQHVLCMSSFWC